MAKRVREDTYLTHDEAENVETAADHLGMSKSEFLRVAAREKIERIDMEVAADA